MAFKKKSPADIVPTQERFPSTADGLETNVKPIDYYIDYPTKGDVKFEVTTQQPGHDVFMYPASIQGVKDDD